MGVSSIREWGQRSAAERLGAADNIQGDRNWSSLGQQNIKLGFLVIIHILCLGSSLECIK